ncbi:DUF1016 N-terminal domain-containing protein [Streptomyces sp. Tu 2975]|uniref:DUF1016 N-terminal domain-containing protein n=1 Tax=Streptomyces sp. Tu 2975 TaxID=2676871 RepID=UPI001FC95A34|nr:DUF1016 N-terminal domain-containing protein [Streptomyces sp. Tu 2975]
MITKSPRLPRPADQAPLRVEQQQHQQGRRPRTGRAPPSWYGDLLGEVKETVSRARVRAQRAVNTELVQMYWEIGRHIVRRQQAEGWGSKVVARLATDLRTAYPNQRGFSHRNLMYMQQMARAWPEPIVQQPVAQLPWGHVILLVTKLRPAPSWTSTP